MPKDKPEFESEAALCAAFIASIDKRKWVVYPETQGWDILLSRKSDGFQIGIQAKMRLNVDVINQAIEQNEWQATADGPDARAVLVPRSGGFAPICVYLGIVVLIPTWGGRFQPYLPESKDTWANQQWPQWAPARRHELPEYVPDAIAGSKSPIQLTEWKIKAIKIAVLLEKRKAVSRLDFKHIGIDPRRWREWGWLIVTERGMVKGAMPDFKGQHPRNYDEIAADFDKWAPKQEGMAV